MASMKRFRVTFQPDETEILVPPGATVLEAARQAGIALATPCGGKGTCGKCLVRLSSSGQDVCACQYCVESDLVVEIPESSRLTTHQILQHGIERTEPIDPTIGERYRTQAGTGPILGLAVDIGTTTVVARLIDLVDGRSLGTEAVLNPQTRFGDDVISRIHHAGSELGREDLHRTIIDCLNDLIGRLCAATGTAVDAIYEACIVGNTTMNHLFLGLPVEQLGQAPYRAYAVEAFDKSPSQLGLAMNPAGNVHTVENIAGFVGADTTAVALAVGMDSVGETTLVVDIGTNGELVLAVDGRLYAASCAAGPALEGARIRQGSRATGGAIEAVSLRDGQIDLEVIGRTAARSICGSGLIDAVAVLLDLGIVDETGRFISPQQAAERCDEAVLPRLVEIDGQGAFCLAFDAETKQPAVVLTQKDIREFQLAKGAILAGIQLLLSKSGIAAGDLNGLLLAGAFGNYIRPRSAVRVGLLPNVPLDRIRFVGNAAASGAEMALLSVACRRRSAALAERIAYVEIAHEARFTEVFADAMMLGPG